MQFDPTLNLSGLINVVAIIITGLGAWFAMRGRLDLLAQRLESVEKKIDDAAHQEKRLTILEERQGTSTKMLMAFQQDISDLRRGDGFIRNHISRNKTVDGEYP